MTTEQYWCIALDYMLTSNDVTNMNALPEINGIPNEFLLSTIKDLEKAKLIFENAGGGLMVKEEGKDYLEHCKAGLEQIKDKPSISLNNVGNTYSNIQDSSITTDTSFDKSTINNIKQTKPHKKSKIDPVYKIVGIITAIALVLLGIAEFWLKLFKKG